ncbi:MAG: glucose-1-phosphate cytidylyltransferase [Polyangiaceae bacterium]
MKTVLLAGGLGTRLSEHTDLKPKPMLEIGPQPILWHIMNIYATHGFSDFVVACGYKGEVIKEYFHSFYIRNADYVVNLKDGSEQVLRSKSPDWKIAVVDTGLHTRTGGRILRLKDWLGGARFMATYGDGVGDVDIGAVVRFHEQHKKLATVTAVRPPARFGGLSLDGPFVREFSEKPQTGEGWINGGFFVFEPEVLDYIKGDSTDLEREPLEKLAADGQLVAYQHHGFWQPMDTLREKRLLESMWESGQAPWKIW